MVLRRCPQCNTTTDDQYGFCIKCGYEFKGNEKTENTCPYCNYENPKEATFCVKCGTPLIFKNQIPQSDIENNPFIIKNPDKKTEPEEYKKTGWLIIGLGYLFSILGGLIGLIIAIYLSTRKDPNARRHGHIQLAILVFYVIIIAIFYLTGNASTIGLDNYTEALQSNFTYNF